MASQFDFYINGVQIDEPKGWDESKRTVRLSSKYRGLFVEYTNELIFHGTGYSEIKSLYDINGFCGEVLVDINYRKSEFENPELYFQGIIKLEDIKINVDHREITVRIEDRSLSSLISSLGSLKVKLNTEKTISGLPLSTVEYTCNAHKATNTTTGIIYDQSRTMYKVFDTFQYLLDYISDKRITFASTLFSTEVTALVKPTFNGAILFTNPGVDLVGAGNVVITYTNAFSEQFVLTIPKQGTVSDTLDYIISQMNFNATGTQRDKFYAQDWRFIPRAVTNGTDTITLTSNIKGFSIDSIVGASASFSWGQSIADEFGSMSICSGNQLRGVDLMRATLTSAFADVTIEKAPEISFDELWSNISNAMNLGMSLSYVAGVLTLRVERYSYFLEQTESISITNIPGITYKSSPYNYNSIDVGDASENLADVGTQNTPDTWISGVTCYNKKLSAKLGWIIDSAQIDEQIRLRPNSVNTATRNAISAPDLYEGLVIYNTDTNELNRAIDSIGGASSWVIADYYYLNSLDEHDDDIFLIECFDSAGNGIIRTTDFENRIYSDTAASFIQYWAYNANLINYNRVRSWMPLLQGDMKLLDYVLDNYETNVLKVIYEFEYPITHTQHKSILANINKFIRFNSGTNLQTERVGWIETIELDNKTGRAIFKLISPR